MSSPDPRDAVGPLPTGHILNGYDIPPGSVMGTIMSEKNIAKDSVARLEETLPVRRVGRPEDILEAVERGMDLFDCILPTSLAQQGVAFTSLGRRSLRRARLAFLEKTSSDRQKPTSDGLARECPNTPRRRIFQS